MKQNLQEHPVVSQETWLEARKEHLIKEKEFTKLRDQLSRDRRQLPWVKISKDYIFDGPKGKETLAELFAGRSQLIVYHFMYDPSWDEGCKSCSFWADNYNGIDIHLNHRDTTLVTISRAPLEKLSAYKERMGWNFKWLSSYHTDFNRDFQVSFSQVDQKAGKVNYNYRHCNYFSSEAPGLSVFYKNQQGELFHTYSCYSRGLDMLNGAYHLLDLTPKGRDEEDLPHTMSWLYRHDEYPATSPY